MRCCWELSVLGFHNILASFQLAQLPTKKRNTPQFASDINDKLSVYRLFIRNNRAISCAQY